MFKGILSIIGLILILPSLVFFKIPGVQRIFDSFGSGGLGLMMIAFILVPIISYTALFASLITWLLTR